MSDVSINVNKKSIYALFSEKKQFIIPEYQRPYSWEEEHKKEKYARSKIPIVQEFIKENKNNSDWLKANVEKRNAVFERDIKGFFKENLK